eukprot:TRINITY_DN12722_c0_g1_i1.p1 TRINITY_DN12722_c0_g1~~TRINITY_DN12722_c0_g1_i1.p1  ORF type:complete len:102 (-),score=16.20 TRINITY_DN12722_c0_g1_i1:394-699(-)
MDLYVHAAESDKVYVWMTIGDFQERNILYIRARLEPNKVRQASFPHWVIKQLGISNGRGQFPQDSLNSEEKRDISLDTPSRPSKYVAPVSSKTRCEGSISS